MAIRGRAEVLLPLAALFLSSVLLLSPSFASGSRGKDRRERGENPYLFGGESFRRWGSTKQGNFSVLEPFSGRSELFRHIEGYRMAILEAEPLTFFLPSHFDAEEVFFVIQGRGTISILWDLKEETYNIKKGDIMAIRAGAVVYGSNSDSSEKLRIALFLKSVSAPGRFQEFFGAGGEKPQSFYRSFSTDVLEATFNVDVQTIERVFRHREGSIVRATEEQIRALQESPPSGDEGGAGAGGESSPEKTRRSPVNIFEKEPCHANEYGQFLQVGQNDYSPLQEMDVDVSFIKISAGSMIAPGYNTEAVKLALVLNGHGCFEMVSPRQYLITKKTKNKKKKRKEEEEEEEVGEEEAAAGYEKIRSDVSPGDLLVVPAGHPVAAFAAGESELEVLCFGIRASRSRKLYLGGQTNLLRLLSRSATELSFGAPAEEVELVFDAQTAAVFLPGPERRRRAESF